MIQKSFFIILILVHFYPVFSQNEKSYYSTILKADSLKLNQHAEESIIYYEKAFKKKKYPPLNDIIETAILAAEQGHDKLSYQLFRKAILNGLPYPELEKLITIAQNLDKRYKSRLLKDFKYLNKKYYAKLNLELVLKLTLIDGYDQGIRNLYFKDSSCKEIYFKAQNTMDTTNLSIIVDIIKKYGWPTFEMVGTKTNVVDLILWHNRNTYDTTANWKFLKDIINRQIKLGKLPPDWSASYDDYVFYKKNKQQLYGTTLYYSNGKKSYLPIYDIKNVDKRRREIGLEDLRTNALKRNVQLPEGY